MLVQSRSQSHTTRVTFEVSGGWWDERTAVALLTLGKRTDATKLWGARGAAQVETNGDRDEV